MADINQFDNIPDIDDPSLEINFEIRKYKNMAILGAYILSLNPVHDTHKLALGGFAWIEKHGNSYILYKTSGPQFKISSEKMKSITLSFILKITEQVIFKTEYGSICGGPDKILLIIYYYVLAMNTIYSTNQNVQMEMGDGLRLKAEHDFITLYNQDTAVYRILTSEVQEICKFSEPTYMLDTIGHVFAGKI